MQSQYSLTVYQSFHIFRFDVWRVSMIHWLNTQWIIIIHTKAFALRFFLLNYGPPYLYNFLCFAFSVIILVLFQFLLVKQIYESEKRGSHFIGGFKLFNGFPCFSSYKI